jgi:hypothetical protein
MLRAIAAEDKGHATAQCYALRRACLSPPRFPGSKAFGKGSAIRRAQHEPMRRKITIPRLTAGKRRSARTIGARQRIAPGGNGKPERFG